MNLLKTDFGVSVATAAGHEPLPIRHIVGIGRNYSEHAKEQGAAVPERPMTFSKNPASLCLNGDEIVVPKICQDRPQVDFEGELGVVVGWKNCWTKASFSKADFVRDVPLGDAFACVLGYVVANDVSARWWQKEGSGGQFNRGKGFDTFCPIGPFLIPAKQLADPQNLSLTTKVNGVTMQDSNTREMIFSVAHLVSDLSRGTTLLPGTLILTGTPSGVGMARTPPVFLKHGDVVEIAIEKLGAISNRVRFE
jgi:2-keto-4-pentenoate hydratase/2-oxohepta-3-ene-1,7-dioic acid hydratase in catechol pathway